MKKRELLIVAAMIFVVAFFIFRTKKISNEDNENEIEQTAETKPAVQVESQNVTTAAPSASSDLTQSVIVNQIKTQLNETILKRFSMNLRDLEKCLRLNANPNLADLVNPTSDNLIAALRPTLGDTVVQIDDWNQYDIIDKSGVKKRIRVDFDYPDGVTPNRRLSMYTINSYGGLEIDNLTNDQADNPNTAYIDSLKDGSQVLSEERSARVYFTQGEELVFTIKNGHLDSFSVSRADKALNCNNVSEENSKCSCP